MKELFKLKYVGYAIIAYLVYMYLAVPFLSVMIPFMQNLLYMIAKVILGLIRLILGLVMIYGILLLLRKFRMRKFIKED